MQNRVEPPVRWVAAVTWAGAVGFLVFGLWALVAPRSFFDSLATFDPYNRHLIHDIGAFQIGLGAVLVAVALPDKVDALGGVLLGVGVGAAMHVVSHLIDVDLGGTPSSDIPSLSVLAVALLAAGVHQVRSTGGGARPGSDASDDG